MKRTIFLISVFLCYLHTIISQDTLIAFYERVNLRDYQVTEIYVISMDSTILEVVSPPKVYLPAPVPQMEMRTKYDLRRNESSFTMISKESQTITSLDARPLTDTIERYSIEESPEDSLRVLSLFGDSTLVYRVTLSDIPSFHPLTLHYSEVITMPVKIEHKKFVTTLRSIITDKDEQRSILAKLQLDLESFRFMTEEDLKREIEQMFGVSYEEHIERIKRMTESRRD